MNPAHIQDIITALKEDKTCLQPWRNKAVARLEEAIAFVHMGHQTSSMKPPAEMMIGNPTKPQGFSGVCTCPAYPHARKSTCPVHGS